MLSNAFSMVEFLKKAEGNNYQRVLTLANREATDVERFLYKQQNAANFSNRLRDYASSLKDFIAYMRYGVKNRNVRTLDLDHFENLRETSSIERRR